MTVLVRRFLADYARTPTNLLLLAVVPVVFVILAAGTLSDAARVLGGAGGGSPSRRSQRVGPRGCSPPWRCTSRCPRPGTPTGASYSPGWAGGNW